MTTIIIDGDITSVETKKRIDFNSYTDLKSPNNKVEIEPTGATTSIYNLSHSSGGGANVGFVLSDDFNIDDMVIVCKTDAISTGEVVVYDSSNNLMAANGRNRTGIMLIKIASGTGSDWISIISA